MNVLNDWNDLNARKLLIAPPLLNRLHPLIFRLRSFRWLNSLYASMTQILRDDIIDRRDIVVQFAQLFFFFEHIFKARGSPVDGKRHRFQIARRSPRIIFDHALFGVGT